MPRIRVAHRCFGPVTTSDRSAATSGFVGHDKNAAQREPIQNSHPAKSGNVAMWMSRRPRESQVIDFLLKADGQPLNYVSAADLDALGGATCFTRTIELGSGKRIYENAVEILTRWWMLPESYVDIFWPARGTQCGTSLAIGMQLYGNYWLNPCRITEFVQTPLSLSEDALTRITWRTIRGHCLVGSESFAVRMTPSGVVSYEVESSAAPVQWLRPFRRPIDNARRNFQRLSCQQFGLTLNRHNRHWYPGQPREQHNQIIERSATCLTTVD